jgi:NitT/TauT family transport system permease protein
MTEPCLPRREIFNTVNTLQFTVRAAPRSRWRRLYDHGGVRKTLVLLVLILVWESYARVVANPLLFPTFGATLGALLQAVLSGELPRAALTTLGLLGKGYLIGVLLAAVLTAFASMTRIGADILETLTAMFNPLPSIALLPLALIWFGLGDNSIIFVLIHAVLWAVALNAFAGFRSVSPTLKMVGRNYGLSRAGFVLRILMPGAFPSILTGLKVGWAFAWRTLIAAELVFGVSSGSGGLGWYINQSKNQLEIPAVFAGLLTVILFGLCIENLVFRVIENRTVRRWGMAS